MQKRTIQDLNDDIRLINDEIKDIVSKIRTLRDEKMALDLSDTDEIDVLDAQIKLLTISLNVRYEALEAVVKKKDKFEHSRHKRNKVSDKYHDSQVKGMDGKRIDPITGDKLNEGAIKIFNDETKAVWTYFNSSTILEIFNGTCTCNDEWNSEGEDIIRRSEHASILVNTLDIDEMSYFLEERYGEDVLGHTEGDYIFKNPMTNDRFPDASKKEIWGLISNSDQVTTRSQTGVGDVTPRQGYGGIYKRGKHKKKNTRKKKKKKKRTTKKQTKKGEGINFKTFYITKHPSSSCHKQLMKQKKKTRKKGHK